MFQTNKKKAEFTILRTFPPRIQWKDGRVEEVSRSDLTRLQSLLKWTTAF